MTTNERLTLTISSIALIVSSLSFLDSHVQVMPNLTIRAATMLRDKDDMQTVAIWMDVRNEGRLQAIVTEVDATPFSTIVGDTVKGSCDHDLLDAETKVTRDFGILGEIAGQHVGRINPRVLLPKSCAVLPARIGVTVVLKYHDVLHIPYSLKENIRAELAKNVGSELASPK